MWMTPVPPPKPPVSGPRSPAAASAALAALVAASATVGWLVGRSSLFLQAGLGTEVKPVTAVALSVGSVLTLVVLLIAGIVLGRWVAARSTLFADILRERRAAKDALVANEKQ